MKSKHCEWCDAGFATNISYQKYCSVECREAATREKIAERYSIKRRNNKKHRNRKCKACQSPLSIYNDGELCSNCLVNPQEVKKTLKEIKGLADGQNNTDS